MKREIILLSMTVIFSVLLTLLEWWFPTDQDFPVLVIISFLSYLDGPFAGLLIMAIVERRARFFSGMPYRWRRYAGAGALIIVMRMSLWVVGLNFERALSILVQEVALNSVLMGLAVVFLCLALKASSRNSIPRPPSDALVVALAAGAGAIIPNVKSGQWFVRNWGHQIGIPYMFEIDANAMVALLLSAVLWAFYACRRRVAVTAPEIAGEAPAGT